MDAIFNKLGDLLIELLNAVVLLLPDSPFIFLESDYIPDEVKNILPYVNWFIPVATILSIVQVWLSAVLVYYAYQVILRWVKAIE